MVEVKIKTCDVSVDFSFFAVLALFFAFDKTGYGFLCLSACICHEVGHLFSMLVHRERFRGIAFYGCGICIQRCPLQWYSFCTCFAGCLINFSFFIIFWFVLPRTNIYFVIFAYLNFYVGVYNMIPAGFLDGKNIFDWVWRHFFMPQTAAAISSSIEHVAIIFGIVMWITGIALGHVNLITATVILFFALYPCILSTKRFYT